MRAPVARRAGAWIETTACRRTGPRSGGSPLFTGDVGRLDDEGFLHLLDRKKDIIITGGENVWSGEVEAVLNRHPDVIEAAVIGVPQETWGETVLAVIVSAPGSDLADGTGKKSLIEHCRRNFGTSQLQ